MGSGEEFANGRGCFNFALAPAAASVVLLAVLQRGLAPGPLPRGICPVCGNEYALRRNRTMGSHRVQPRPGYRLGYCTGIGKPPKIEEGR